MKRVAAVLAAGLMIVAAILVRNGLSDDGVDDAGGDRPASGGLVCPDGLASLCRSAGVDLAAVEDASRTADRLLEATSADELGGAAWLVPAAWADLVVAERARLGAPPLFERSAPLATTSMVIAIWADRRTALEGGDCGAVDWGCIAAAAVEDPLFGIGMTDVDDALGLPAAVVQAADLVGLDDFAANDFDATWQTRARRLATGQGDDPLSQMRTRGPGALSAVAVTRAEAGSVASSFGTIDLVDGDRAAARVDLVLLTPADRPLGGIARDALAAAARDEGWGAPAGDDAVLPGGSVIAAIRTVWDQNR